jgi:hypothetical protein
VAHDERCQSWLELHASGLSWARIGDRFGLTPEAIKKRTQRWRAEQPATAPMAVQFPELKAAPAQGWSGDYLEAIIDAQDQMAEHDTTQNKVPINLPDNLPVGICFSGDWHIGGRGTDHRLLREYLYLWRHTPGLKLIGMGDYAELFMGKLARIGLEEHIMAPDMQIGTVEDLIKGELSDSLIALLKGNHDNWAGHYQNFVMTLAQSIHPTGHDRPGIPYIGIGGEIDLTVGAQAYRIAAWHRYPGGSAINKGNNQRRVNVDHKGPDVTVLAHLHYNYMEGTDDIRLRCGALKVTDEHSRDAAGNVQADTRMPMIIFHPARKSMIVFQDFREGIEPLLWYRRRWASYPDWRVDPSRLANLLAQ